MKNAYIASFWKESKVNGDSQPQVPVRNTPCFSIILLDLFPDYSAFWAWKPAFCRSFSRSDYPDLRDGIILSLEAKKQAEIRLSGEISYFKSGKTC
ncbi:MAG: hypothetical protein H6581_01000 [Bacteroidia bacterium]|nr:hypothetical protein [Bacteroidia bacterium]